MNLKCDCGGKVQGVRGLAGGVLPQAPRQGQERGAQGGEARPG